jgi:hypothetical protein
VHLIILKVAPSLRRGEGSLAETEKVLLYGKDPNPLPDRERGYIIF